MHDFAPASLRVYTFARLRLYDFSLLRLHAITTLQPLRKRYAHTPTPTRCCNRAIIANPTIQRPRCNRAYVVANFSVSNINTYVAINSTSGRSCMSRNSNNHPRFELTLIGAMAPSIIHIASITWRISQSRCRENLRNPHSTQAITRRSYSICIRNNCLLAPR